MYENDNKCPHIQHYDRELTFCIGSAALLVRSPPDLIAHRLQGRLRSVVSNTPFPQAVLFIVKGRKRPEIPEDDATKRPISNSPVPNLNVIKFKFKKLCISEQSNSMKRVCLRLLVTFKVSPLQLM